MAKWTVAKLVRIGGSGLDADFERLISSGSHGNSEASCCSIGAMGESVVEAEIASENGGATMVD